MKPIKYLVVAGFASMVVSVSQAQVAQNVKERVQDRRNLHQDVANIQAERSDVDRLSDLVMHWNALRAANAGPQKILAVQNQIAEELRNDLKLTSAQKAEAVRKARQANQELRADRRNVRHEARDVQAAQSSGNSDQAVQEQQELRNDLRDKRDDRHDVAQETRDKSQINQILAQKRDLVTQMCTLQKQIDTGSKNIRELQYKQEGLLQQYLVLSQQEVTLGLRQYVDDQQEIREDRRESHEDIHDLDW